MFVEGADDLALADALFDPRSGLYRGPHLDLGGQVEVRSGRFDSAIRRATVSCSFVSSRISTSPLSVWWPVRGGCRRGAGAAACAASTSSRTIRPPGPKLRRGERSIPLRGRCGGPAATGPSQRGGV